MEVRSEEETGWPSQQALRQRIAAYARVDRVKSFKIGITNNPTARAALYRYQTRYDEMILVYRTSSDAMVRNTERELTEWFWDDCENEILGGGGPSGEPPYYLYVVVRY
jgi:hypothetical protein